MDHEKNEQRNFMRPFSACGNSESDSGILCLSLSQFTLFLRVKSGWRKFEMSQFLYFSKSYFCKVLIVSVDFLF